VPSVYQRKSDGRWVLATTVDGKQKSRYFKTEAEARAALSAAAAEERETLGHHVATWLAGKEGIYRASTLAQVRDLLSLFLPPIAHTRLSELTPALLRDTLVASSLGSARKVKAHSTLRVCLGEAVMLGLIPENPMLRVPRPGHRPKKRDYWTQEQAKQFLAVALAPKMYGPRGLFALLLLTGLRISEALGLEWRDVDLGRRRVEIRRALVYTKDCRYVEEETKTRSSRRVISLTDTATEVLRRRRATTSGQHRVFTGRYGNTPEPSNLRRDLGRACKAAGVPYVSPHGLRHVHAMLALEATGDVYAVQRRLGHSDVATTVGVYGYSKRDDTETAQALDRLLAEPTSPASVQPRKRSAALVKARVSQVVEQSAAAPQTPLEKPALVPYG
jgi:integrase